MKCCGKQVLKICLQARKKRSGRGVSHHHLEEVAVAVCPQDLALFPEQLAQWFSSDIVDGDGEPAWFGGEHNPSCAVIDDANRGQMVVVGESRQDRFEIQVAICDVE